MISFSLSFTCAANKHCAYIGRKQSARLAAGQRSQRGVQGKQLAGGSVKGSIMSFLMQSLTHCVDTTMPAGTKRANMLQWHTRVLRPAKQRCGGPNGGPSGGGGGPMIALLRSRRHPRAATPPPGAHWRAAACSAGTCTCVARGEVQASDSASGSSAGLQSRRVGKQSRHAPLFCNLAAQILRLVEPRELDLRVAQLAQCWRRPLSPTNALTAAPLPPPPALRRRLPSASQVEPRGGAHHAATCRSSRAAAPQ